MDSARTNLQQGTDPSDVVDIWWGDMSTLRLICILFDLVSDCRGDGFARSSSSSHPHLLLGKLLLLIMMSDGFASLEIFCFDFPFFTKTMMHSFAQTSPVYLAVRFTAKNGWSRNGMPGIQEHPRPSPILNTYIFKRPKYHGTHSRFSSLYLKGT